MKAEYDFYASAYHGSMPEEDFLRYGVQAEAFLADLISHRSCDNLSEGHLYQLRLAFCALCDAYAKEETADITSEQNDGISVTYGARKGTSEERLRNAAALFLSGTGLLYRGNR